VASTLSICHFNPFASRPFRTVFTCLLASYSRCWPVPVGTG